MTSAYEIRMANDGDLSEIADYLSDHVRDNGANGAPLFQPQARDADWPRTEKLRLFRHEIQVPVGDPHWRRFWLAFCRKSEIAAHIDLRARPEPHTSHRALLGMGVHRDHRRQGIGKMLVTVALDWARAHSGLEWVDLDVLARNSAARSLYQGAGFQELATVQDMFRIDGEAVDHIFMTRRIRIGAPSEGEQKT